MAALECSRAADGSPGFLRVPQSPAKALKQSFTVIIVQMYLPALSWSVRCRTRGLGLGVCTLGSLQGNLCTLKCKNPLVRGDGAWKLNRLGPRLRDLPAPPLIPCPVFILPVSRESVSQEGNERGRLFQTSAACITGNHANTQVFFLRIVHLTFVKAKTYVQAKLCKVKQDRDQQLPWAHRVLSSLAEQTSVEAQVAHFPGTIPP